MKARITLFFIVFFSFCLNTFSQSDSLGMAGDNLDLQAVLTIFKDSKNIEEFEKKLNTADTKVNNLDLNGDGQVDYLRVIDTQKDSLHSIIIQAPISKSESQDVAVIHVERKGTDEAHLQIIGDTTLYGKDYIIEPTTVKSTPKEKLIKKESNEDDVYKGRDEVEKKADKKETQSKEDNPVIVNVWTWPSVVYLYSPGYVMWVSPYYWSYYPYWYDPWAPYPWYVYHRHIVSYPYIVPCHYGYYYYSPKAHNMYYGRRTSSGYVEKTAPKYKQRVTPGERNKSGEKQINTQPENRNKGRVKQGKGEKTNPEEKPNKADPNRVPQTKPNQTKRSEQAPMDKPTKTEPNKQAPRDKPNRINTQPQNPGQPQKGGRINKPR